MRPLTGLAIAHAGVDALAGIEAVMGRAFDPVFGEAWSPAQCLAVLSMPGYALRIASIGTQISGFAIIRWVADDSELLLIAVDPAARGQGIGTALIGDWLTHGRATGASRFFLEMRTDNPAQRLYAQMGFAMCGHRPGYYKGADGAVRDAITMQRLMV
jgi:[ribosomal protein S18]-alanine N-acetyltransferase